MNRSLIIDDHVSIVKVKPWPNFLPAPGAKAGTATLFQIAANVFEKLFRVACSVSFDAQKAL
jgi:hypothetical protein